MTLAEASEQESQSIAYFQRDKLRPSMQNLAVGLEISPAASFAALNSCVESIAATENFDSGIEGADTIWHRVGGYGIIVEVPSVNDVINFNLHLIQMGGLLV